MEFRFYVENGPQNHPLPARSWVDAWQKIETEVLPKLKFHEIDTSTKPWKIERVSKEEWEEAEGDMVKRMRSSSQSGVLWTSTVPVFVSLRKGDEEQTRYYILRV